MILFRSQRLSRITFQNKNSNFLEVEDYKESRRRMFFKVGHKHGAQKNVLEMESSYY